MIKEAFYIKDYQLKVVFTDGTIKMIDLYNFISTSKHPLINKFLDKNLFREFYIDYGTICWGDNEFDINPKDIYNGKFDVSSTTNSI